jgi:cellobiose phosphorylase
MALEMNANGSLRRFEHDGILVNLFVGNEVESGPANIYLRCHRDTVESIPLLGPHSYTRFYGGASPGMLHGFGSWMGIDYSLALVLGERAPGWFWHVHFENKNPQPQHIDLTYVQDLALAPYGAVRLNEFYVSQYIDHTPLTHAAHGVVVASRQNLAVNGRHPWALVGSLREGRSFATDAVQFHALSGRTGHVPPGLSAELPGRRLQHEHSMVVVRDAPIRLAPNGKAVAGFFGSIVADHPPATSASDLERVDEVLALPEAAPVAMGSRSTATIGSASGARGAATLFGSAPLLPAADLDADALRKLFGSPRRHEEADDQGRLLSFFHGADSHVVLRAKELRVLRPHGHLLRTGRHLTPDESALTSTAWMAGVFHSMLAQGHVSINRFLSTVHSYVGLFRSHGQRVFVEIGGEWQLLHVPSAFEISPDSCRWIYRYEHGRDQGEIHVRAEARTDPHELTLAIEIVAGSPARFLISHHIALNGDDGSAAGPAQWSRDGGAITLRAAPGGDVAHRFPSGSFQITPFPGDEFAQVGGDELLFLDGRSREQPFLCVVTDAVRSIGMTIRGNLIADDAQNALCVQPGRRLIPTLPMSAPAAGSHAAEQLARISDIVPWFMHNALVHYLSPRGLEQYSGGGWGTRDVCQGPVEMLLALDRVEPIRDLLLRVLSHQNSDGDWPQWFMFFERERNIRPGDSHGDIVFWPLVVLAQYLVASGDAGVLDEQVPFFDARGSDAGERATVWQHAQRALSLIERRVVPGTALAAYGHGDWNDSLQPANPAMRDQMCSAWTVTLHFQMLNALAGALQSIGRIREAAPLERAAGAVRRDFQRLLVIDGVLTGYALFEDAGNVRYLLHPRDDTTGVHYSALAMIHAILEDLLTPEQVRQHLHLIDAHLSAPDGVRLFDRPMRYHGGLQRFFQRAESATFFGREIGLMYMHAHLRYAQALAHVGEANRFFKALCQANPIGIRSIVPSATLRQANCYYSSSDAAFEDRYQASAEYARVVDGTIPFDGGWRVYSSGAGIALGLIVRRFLGLSCEADALCLDPVIPGALDGLRVETTLRGHAVEVQYRIGPSGCGVKEIVLNGVGLAFSRRANPHRLGAAQVPMTAVLERLTSGRNVLGITLG